MGAQGTRLGTAAVAVVLVLVGVLTKHWCVASVSGLGAAGSPAAYFGLRAVSQCMGGVCVSVDYGGLPAAGLGAAFKVFASVAFFAGIAGAILLAAGVALRELQSIDNVASGASLLLGLTAIASIAAVVTFPGQPSAIPGLEIHTSTGFSFYLTLVGAILGAVAGRLPVGAGWEGRTYVPVRLAGANAGPDASAHPTPAPASARTPSPSSSGLRFVARSIEISSVGMTAILEDSGQVDLLWSQVGRVIARRPPPDPPYAKGLFVDIVPAASGSRPIRIVSTTRANWADLPGGAAVRSQDNLRALGVLIEDHRRGAIEPNSAGFFRQNQRAPAFPAPRQLAEYDAQYGDLG